MLVPLTACPGCGSGDSLVSLTQQLESSQLENRQLQRQLDQVNAEKQQLDKQLQVVSGLEAGAFENLYRVQSINITRYTNLYDKDNDGTDETLIVYIQPIDEQGDVVKAVGDVEVQLWDLNKPSQKAMLGQWQIKPEQLKEEWLATLLTINYRLTFEVADKIDGIEGPLTVKVTFTDHLTGKVFKEQRTIKP